MAAILVAEYSKGPKNGPKAWLDINRIENGARYPVEAVGVSGKAEARRIARERGAQPWNF